MKFEDMIDKIICGDCLEVMKNIPDKSIDLVFTDPPYNILMSDDIKTSDAVIVRNADFDKNDFDINKFMDIIERVLNDGGTFLIFCSDRQLGKYIDYCNKSASLRYSNTLVWVDILGHPSVRKRSFSNHSQYIVFGHKEIECKYIFNWLGEKRMSNVLNFIGCTSFEYGKVRNGRVGEWVSHPTQKPSKLIGHLIKICSNEKDLVLDPFLGSGTTAVACKRLNRRFIGIEINKEYCEIAEKRIMNVPERLDSFI